MLSGRQAIAVLAAVVATGAAAGCGGDDGGPTPATSAEAKATLSKDCQNGKASDKPLCDCIGDKLEEGGSDAAQILALGKEVNEGKMPAAITKAATTCATSLGG